MLAKCTRVANEAEGGVVGCITLARGCVSAWLKDESFYHLEFLFLPIFRYDREKPTFSTLSLLYIDHLHPSPTLGIHLSAARLLSFIYLLSLSLSPVYNIGRIYL